MGLRVILDRLGQVIVEDDHGSPFHKTRVAPTCPVGELSADLDNVLSASPSRHLPHYPPLSRAGLVFVFILCIPLPVFAQWVVGAYIGTAHTQNSSLFIDQPTLNTRLQFNNVAYEGQSFRSPFYYGGHGGYFFNSHWGVEAEFIHLKVFAKTALPVSVSGTLSGQPLRTVEPMSTIVQHFSISHGVNLLLADVPFRAQLWQRSGQSLGRLLVNFRFGVGATLPHPESKIAGQVNEHYQTGSPAFQAAAGVELQLWHRLYWEGEYKYTYTRQHLDVFSGRAQTLLNSHHLVTGPLMHF